MPAICGPEENYPFLQMSSTEVPFTLTAAPLPTSMDLLAQDSPDSSTSPKVKQPNSVEKRVMKKEGKVQVKKQKTRAVFSTTQLCILNNRFQKQKYLTLQQMQELFKILNLSYKQVKTWFQNQRMKSKRWQKNNWLKNTNSVTQTQASAPIRNLPVWSNQTWGNPTWGNPTWSSQSWSNRSWNSQTWCTHAWNSQAWNNPFFNCGEEPLQSCLQVQQNCLALEAAGESHNVIHQTTKDFSSPQTVDSFLNYSMNMQPEDV
ncbi:homeobox protein NANOG-like [Nycticebus coucang]|uniref:homeobox protein NANOG-like n=1 Tax=Nycticebus coucang TaxID=9470 RepID=UPI00234C2001|nr:homeobox protein NANOG-like [Nycticebus coucang]